MLTAKRTLEQWIRVASEYAARDKEVLHVVEVDHEEDRDRQIWTEREVCCDEFIAFAGEIIATVYPDGRIE